MSIIFSIVGFFIFLATLAIASQNVTKSLKMLTPEEKVLYVDQSSKTQRPLFISLGIGTVIGLVCFLFIYPPLGVAFFGGGFSVGTWKQYQIIRKLEINPAFKDQLKYSTWLFITGSFVFVLLI